MENVDNMPANFCTICQEIIDTSQSFSVEQEMYFHQAECDPSAKKRKAAKKLQADELEAINPLATDEDYIREVNAVCGQEVKLKKWQLEAVKLIIKKYTMERKESFILADEMGLGKYVY